MTTGSGDSKSLRASHDDREQVITALKAAFVHGRLTSDELACRAGMALTATTWADLAALTADLPGGGPAAPPARPASRPSARKRRRTAARKAAVVTVMTVPPFAMVLTALLTRQDWLGRATVIPLLVYFMVWIAAGLQTFSNWLDRRSARKSLPPPAAPRELAREEESRPPYRGPLDGLILSEQHPPVTARPRLNPA